MKAELYAPYGRLGCDAPKVLFDRFIDRLNQTEMPDVVFLPGDLIGHGSVLNLRQPYSAHAYEEVMAIHRNISQAFATKLPSALLIPSLGNNDWLYHYQSPPEGNKTDYFSRLYDLWFAHQHLKPVDNATTFLNGGYYRMDVAPGLAVLALNTLVWNTNFKYHSVGNESEEQMTWLEQ